MKKLITAGIILLVAVILFFLMGPLYVLNEGEQAVVLRFGQIRKVETEAGLKFKTPFIDNVVKYTKRILSWDGDAKLFPTKENQFIFVDTTARWKIVDPVKFYESVSTMQGAYSKLDDVIDSAVRNIISANYMREAVRNSNQINQSTTRETFETGDLEGSDSLRQLTQSNTAHEVIEKGRSSLSQSILNLSRQLTPDYGIELIDVLPRQIRYSDELTPSVYERMIKERNQIAQAFRSFGEGRKQEWIGKQENELRSILSKAYEEAEIIKGQADATASRIYADAYSKDVGFFNFWRAIESYRTTLPKFTKTLSTSAEYFDYLYGPNGR
ncbi:MAG: protease modulator HflC [Spirochaetes bacterium]|nr:protease modulator HflC [Spirochaetota bacterium]